MSSSGSAITLYSHTHESAEATPSHFSALSRTSSGNDMTVELGKTRNANSQSHQSREVFRWTQLRTIGDYVYGKHSQKASTLLGTVNAGSPTVLAANGLICIGTDTGQVLVFDFKQNLKCTCGPDHPGKCAFSFTLLS